MPGVMTRNLVPFFGRSSEVRYAIGSFLLLVAALLEAGGDALVRMGIAQGPATTRALALCGGGLVLFAYGYVVNAAPWDFGRLLGVYIVFFFIVAQAIAWLVFGQAPSRGVYLGGAFIVIGSAIVATSVK